MKPVGKTTKTQRQVLHLRERSHPHPHEGVTVSRERETSTSAAGEAPPAVKRLLEEWLTNTLSNILDKPVQRDIEGTIPAETATIANEPETARAGNTHIVIDAGNDALAAILKKMEEMKNENKIFRDQMKEHQKGLIKYRALRICYQNVT